MAAIFAVCSSVSVPVQPNMFFWNFSLWSKGKTESGRSEAMVMMDAS
jgi:hypothetical protein